MALGRNIRPDAGLQIERLFEYRIAAMDYYRLVRNAVAHPSPEAENASKTFFEKNASLLQEVRKQYGMQSAPNAMDRLSFHDIKLLARVALDVTKVIDELLDPGDRRFQELLADRPVDNTKSPDRRFNSLAGWLQTEHGLNHERAIRIIHAHMTQELGG